VTRLNGTLISALVLAFGASLLAGRVWIDPFHADVPGAG
jgi:iron complex transport system permease protein